MSALMEESMVSLVVWPAETRFGELLKKIREAHGLSQSKVSEKADYDHSYVSRLESGARMPTRDAVSRLADAIGADEHERSDLFVAAGYMPGRFGPLFGDCPELAELAPLLEPGALDERSCLFLREELRGLIKRYSAFARDHYVARAS